MDKVGKKTLANDILKKLRKAIILGELPVNEHLAEPLLAEQLGTSRGPVRDALQILLREGFVVRLPNGRVVVKGISTEDISNLYDFRFLLENYAIEQWVTKGKRTSLNDLRYCIDQMDSRLVTSEEFSELDMRFHEIMIQLAKNQSLHQSWLGLKEVMHSILVMANQSYPRSEFIIETHEQIYSYLKASEITQASKTLRVHLEEGKQIICGQIDQLKALQVR